MRPKERIGLFEANGALHYDISPLADTSIKDLSLEVVRDYFLKYNAFDLYEESKEALERILINADIMTEADGARASERKLLCTVGGLLVFGRDAERRLPQNGVFLGDNLGDSRLKIVPKNSKSTPTQKSKNPIKSTV
jgi:ATP-dependent DNA helicase RecG